MDQTTENYECLVINNNAKSNKLYDQIFWYKAETRPDFRLGSKEFWDISKNLGSDDEDEEGDDESDEAVEECNQGGNFPGDEGSDETEAGVPAGTK